MSDEGASKIRATTTRRHAGRPPQLWTINRAAVFFGTSTAAIYARVRRGVLPALKIGKRVYINPREIDHMIQTHRWTGR